MNEFCKSIAATLNGKPVKMTNEQHREFAMASGEMTDAEFLAFNEAWMEAVLPCLCDGGVFGTFIDGGACRRSTRRP